MDLNISKTKQGFRLYQKQILDLPLSEVFAFFADAHNLERITPPWLQFKILTPGLEKIHQGSFIEYRIKLRGLPLRWKSEITNWNPPYRFTDEQRKGPYKFWIHEHRFSEQAGKTIIEDEVHYNVWGGSWVERLFVRRDLMKIFSFRQKSILDILAKHRSV